MAGHLEPAERWASAHQPFQINRAHLAQRIRLVCTCRKGHGKAQKAAFEERRRAATLLFMKSLPGLLHKYQTDPVQACSDNHLVRLHQQCTYAFVQRAVSCPRHIGMHLKFVKRVCSERMETVSLIFLHFAGGGAGGHSGGPAAGGVQPAQGGAGAGGAAAPAGRHARQACGTPDAGRLRARPAPRHRRRLRRHQGAIRRVTHLLAF